MEYLINELIERLEKTRSEEKARTLQYQQLGVEKAVLLLTGKILALEFCIGELQKMIAYAHQGEIHK